MAERTPRLLKRVKWNDKWERFPVAMKGDKYDFSRIVVLGALRPAPDGVFVLEYYDPKKKRRSVGNDPKVALAALKTQAGVLELRRSGVEVADAPQIRQQVGPDGLSIAAVVKAFKDGKGVQLRPKSKAKYGNALATFEAWAAQSGVTHLSQVERKHISGYVDAQVVDGGLEVRTAVDKGMAVLTTLRKSGAVVEMSKGDWPRYTETERAIYAPETLQQLFSGDVTEWEYAVYQTFLQTGFREAEIVFLGKRDFLPRQQQLKVTRKPHLGFEPKNYEERTVPLSTPAVKLLEEHLARWSAFKWFAGSELMFPTNKGHRDNNLLEKLKVMAKRKGMNCGECAGMWERKPVTCRTHPVCKRFGLHMFRHTYATTLLRDAVDIPTLQKLLGHKDVKSTMVYLKSLQPEMALERLEKSSLTAFL